jgi:hypothetical protein
MATLMAMQWESQTTAKTMATTMARYLVTCSVPEWEKQWLGLRSWARSRVLPIQSARPLAS